MGSAGVAFVVLLVAYAASGWIAPRSGFRLVLELPADRPRPLHPVGRGGRSPLFLGPERTEALRALSRREGVSRFMLVTALSATLFHRLSGQDRLITGTLNARKSIPAITAPPFRTSGNLAARDPDWETPHTARVARQRPEAVVDRS